MEYGRRMAERHVVAAGEALGRALTQLHADDTLRHSIELHIQILMILVKALANSDIGDAGENDGRVRPGHHRAALMQNRHLRTID